MYNYDAPFFEKKTTYWVGIFGQYGLINKVGFS